MHVLGWVRDARCESSRSTVRDVDSIIVMNDGVVEEVGSHAKLMRLEHGLYKQLVETSQRREQVERP